MLFRSYRQARAEGAQPELLLALNTLAICQGTSGSYIESVATAIDAFRLATKLADAEGAAHALTTLAGSSNYILDTADVAMKMLDHCLARGAALGDKSLEVRVRNARAVNLGLMNRFAEADEEFNQALALIDRSDGTTPASLIVGNIAHFHVKKAALAVAGSRPELLATAGKSIDVALEGAVREQNIGAEVRAYFNRGLLYLQVDDPRNALKLFAKSLELAEPLNLKSRVIDTYIEIGVAHVALEQFEEAAAAYDAAFKEADSQRPSKQLTVALEGLAAVYDKMELPRKAAHSRSMVKHERAEFERESQHARSELTSFWREIERTVGVS